MHLHESIDHPFTPRTEAEWRTWATDLLRDGGIKQVVSSLVDAVEQVHRYGAALVECAAQAGADVSGGMPTWPTVDEWAVREVRQLREDYEAALREIR